MCTKATCVCLVLFFNVPKLNEICLCKFNYTQRPLISLLSAASCSSTVYLWWNIKKLYAKHNWFKQQSPHYSTVQLKYQISKMLMKKIWKHPFLKTSNSMAINLLLSVWVFPYQNLLKTLAFHDWYFIVFLYQSQLCSNIGASKGFLIKIS